MRTAGNLVTSLATGARFAVSASGGSWRVAGLIAAVGAVLLAAAAVWAMVLIGALLIGMAAGLLDTGLNTVIALVGPVATAQHAARRVRRRIGDRPARRDGGNFGHVVAAGVLSC